MTDHNHDETARRITSQGVRYCVSHLISELMAKAFEPEALITEDECQGLAYRPADADDYRDAHDCDEGEVISFTVAGSENGLWQATTYPDGRGQDCEPGESETFDDELEAWEWLFDETGQDRPEGCEALEHWLVDQWTADQLRREGESVVELEGLGLTVWARCTSGQAIYADGVMQRIARRIAAA